MKLSDICELSTKEILEINEMHSFYISKVSNDVFALSLESSYCIAALIKKIKPTSIWDLGSGFTTWLCHYITKSSNIKTNILTVETSKEWGKTVNAFFTTQNLTTDSHILGYDEIETFLYSKKTPELIIHDIGDKYNFGIRQKLLPFLGKLCSKGAFLFVDDIHKPEINAATRNTQSRHNLSIQDLSCFTCDKFGRYAWLLIPPDYVS